MVNFPPDADVLTKVFLVCATFAIDFLFFPKKAFGEAGNIAVAAALGTATAGISVSGYAAALGKDLYLKSGAHDELTGRVFKVLST